LSALLLRLAMGLPGGLTDEVNSWAFRRYTARLIYDLPSMAVTLRAVARDVKNGSRPFFMACHPWQPPFGPSRTTLKMAPCHFSRSISMVDPVELNRLFWHSRRGMLELDVLLVPFVREVYPHLDADDRERYRKLLECEDQDMFGWFMQRAEPDDADLKRMVRMILDRVQPQ